MHVFKDSSQRQWEIVINVGTAKAVRDLTNVDIFRLHTTEAERVFGDPVLLVDVLFVLCREQCKQRNMTDEDFGRSMTGDSIEEGANALLEECAAFFPRGRRELLQKQMSKAEEMTTKMMAKANKALDELDLDKMLSASSTASPASSE